MNEQTEAVKSAAQTKGKPDPLVLIGILLAVLSFFGYDRVVCELEFLLRETTK